MARLAEGDRSVFSQVFERLWHPTLRLCKRLLRHDADAADAAQEAMQKILERAPGDYDRARAALPWALAIAAWECRTILRRRGRRRETAETESADLNASDPEVALLQRDLERAALEALGVLSESDRETLVGTFWEEAGSASVRGAALASGAAVRKRRQRALARLRDAFRRLYGLD
jgi:RNA polymerase sigma-70 factor, ECF subfamily